MFSKSVERLSPEKETNWETKRVTFAFVILVWILDRWRFLHCLYLSSLVFSPIRLQVLSLWSTKETLFFKSKYFRLKLHCRMSRRMKNMELYAIPLCSVFSTYRDVYSLFPFDIIFFLHSDIDKKDICILQRIPNARIVLFIIYFP